MMVSPLLEKFKRVRDDLYNFRCPYCGDSKKFQNKARGFLYRKKNDYFYRCHNCDVGTNLTNFIKFVSADLYKEYVIEKYKGKDPEEKFEFEAPKFKKKDPHLEELISINKLSVEHPARQFVESRKIPEEFFDDLYLCPKFVQWSNIQSQQEHPRLVIPFRDETGEVFAAQGRAFGKEIPKYLTLKFDDKPKIFGLERVDFSRRFYVVEGPIDSLFLDNCLAAAGTDFRQLPPGEVTIVLDNEPRSIEITKLMERLIHQNYELVIWPDTIKQKDINDMVLAGVKDIKTIIDNNTFSGLEAQLKLAVWRHNNKQV